ncbi:ADP-ribosyltransferase [Rhodococcus sp. NPDC057297]|uniref:ADP-ribosyltransferase n=1 Tax=Rhodococcus sp. NPDC057297 TaxID=3346090 RepID=UPI0036334B16
MTQVVVDRATTRVTRLWREVDPYDGVQVEAFTKAAAQVTVAAQQRVALIHTESQVQQLASMGIDVQVAPEIPVDVRLASRVEVLEDIDSAPSVTVEYADSSDAGSVSVTVDAEDSTTEQVFNRPARAYRYQRSVDVDEETANDIAEKRIVRIIDGNAILAQRMAEEQVLQAAVDLDAPIIGWRRIIHPEIVTKTGVCGLCIAAATRMYSIDDLKPLHDNCNCTVAAVTEDEDPGLELNEEDLAALYEAAGAASGKDRSTWAADLKKTRYRTDEHGELGLVLKPEAGEAVKHFAADLGGGRTPTRDEAASGARRDQVADLKSWLDAEESYNQGKPAVTLSEDDGRELGAAVWFDYADKLPDRERAAVQFYTGNGYEDINEPLRDGSIGADSGILAKAALIDEAIESAPRVPGKVIVGRSVAEKVFGIPPRAGYKLEESNWQDRLDHAVAQIGRPLRDDGFMSTAFQSEGFRVDYNEARLLIEVPAGAKGLYVSAHPNVGAEPDPRGLASYGPEENELLLGRGVEYEIVDVSMDPGNGDLTIALTITGQSPKSLEEYDG